MKFWVGVTDFKWFKFLSNLSPDEVNFWRPGGSNFSAITPGAPFLFKLHKPYNKIVGGGFFLKSESIQLSLAWDAFEKKNGAETLKELISLINKHRTTKENNPKIGCIILNEPFFLKESEWIDVPEDWSYNIVSGKVYDAASRIGARLWNDVTLRLNSEIIDIQSKSILHETIPLYGKEYLIKSRIGQGAFRILVTSAYDKKCAISGEKALPVLEAAHIKPYIEQGPNRIDNGILLRSDLHILFDRGYLTITPDYKIEVSNKIKDEFENGKNYYAFHGKDLIVLPGDIENRPRLDFINWHNQNIYK